MPAHSVAYSPNGAHLAVGGINGVIKILNVADMTQLLAQVRRQHAINTLLPP